MSNNRNEENQSKSDHIYEVIDERNNNENNNNNRQNSLNVIDNTIVSNQNISSLNNVNQICTSVVNNSCSSNDSNEVNIIDISICHDKRAKIHSAFTLCHTFNDYKLYGCLTGVYADKFFGIDYLPLSNDRLLIQNGDRFEDKVFLFVSKNENRGDLIYYFVGHKTLLNFFEGKL